MAAVSSIQSGASAGHTSALSAADTNTSVAATLIKKLAQADKNLVATLLPVQSGHVLDIAA